MVKYILIRDKAEPLIKIVHMIVDLENKKALIEALSYCIYWLRDCSIVNLILR